MAPLHNNRTRMKTKRQQQRDRIKALLIAAMAGILALVLAVVLIVVGIVRNAQTTPETDTNTDITEQPPAPVVEISLPKDFIDRNTAADYITVYDVTSDKVLYEKNADTRCYPASTTKILTCLVTLKYAQSSTVFTVGNEIRLIDPQSSRAYLQIGQRLDLQTMLEAIMLPSGNDAAYTAAANIGRIIAGDQNLDASAAIKRFCSEMNKMAAELGAKDSHFENPDGIHQANHYTTAHDLALIAKAALAQPTLKR